MQKISSQEVESFQTLKQTIEYRLFPDLFARLFEKGEIVQYEKDSLVMESGDDFDQLIIPLRGVLLLRIRSGRAFDETDLITISEAELFGTWEILDRRRCSYNVKAEETVVLFACMASDFRSEVKKDKTVEKVFRVLAVSRAIRRFAGWLLENGLKQQDCIRALELIATQEQIMKKGGELRIREPHLVFIQSGQVGISKTGQAKDVITFLKGGQFFGGSQAAESLDRAYYAHFISDVVYHAVSVAVIGKVLGGELLKVLAREPDIDIRNEGLTRDELWHLTGAKRANPALLARFQLPVLEDIALSDRTQRSTASVVLVNFFQLIEMKVPLSLISPLVALKTQMSLSQMASIVEHFGLMTRIVHLDQGSLHRTILPGLTIFSGRPVVLVGVLSGHVLFIDPFAGMMAMNQKRFFGRWSGVLLEIEKSPVHNVTVDEKGEGGMPRPEIVGRLILRFFQEKAKPLVIQVLSMNSFQTFIIVLIPTFFMSLLSDILGSRSYGLLQSYFVGLSLMAIFQMISQWMQRRTTGDLQNDYTMRSHRYFYKLTIDAPSNYVSPIKTGSVIAKFASIDFLFGSDWKRRVQLPVSIVGLVLYGLIVSSYSWAAGSLLLIFGAGTIALVSFIRNKVGLDELSTVKLRQDVVDRWTERLAGMDSIKSNGSEKYFRDQSDQTAIELMRQGTVYQLSMQRLQTMATFLFGLAPVAALYVVAVAYLNKSLAMDDLVGVSIYAAFCSQPVMGLVSLILYSSPGAGLLQNIGGMARVETEKRIRKLESLIPISFKGKIRFDRVSYRYTERSGPALSEVSFSIEPGQVVAIVGRSGSGKTTLARLISRHLKPQGGKIYYDDVDSREINEESLVEQIGYVTQNPQLFLGTIASNIGYSDDMLNMDRILRAARAAGAHEFVSKLKGGYSYCLTEEGFGLSTGQKQLISMARAMYQNPRMLILDEATVHLDPKSEKLLSDRLLKYLNYRTVVVIVQRISTARKADLILVMKSGRLVEAGSHNQLMQSGGEYAELYRNQVGVE